MTGTAALQATLEQAAAHHRAGDLAAALPLYAVILRTVPAEGLVLHLTGAALHAVGRPQEGLRWLLRAEALHGADPVLQHNLGEAAWASGAAARAQRAYMAAIRLRPDLVDSRISLSFVLRELGAFADADREARIALVLTPSAVRGHLAFGLSREMAVGPERAAAVDPAYAGAWVNLGAMLLRDMTFGPAARACRRATALAPATGESWVNYGSVLLSLGRPTDAVRVQRRGLTLRPTPDLHSNVIFSMLSDPATNGASTLAEARRWAARYGPGANVVPKTHDIPRDPDRRLTIGYVSGDFRRHPVAGNIIELVERHDPRDVAVNCYAEVYRPDDMTRRFRARADRWMSTIGVPDTDVAAAIQGDRVDILVFLGGHTAASRLPLARWRPAPILVSFHAPCTTGLEAVDYWLSDDDLTPGGLERHFSERIYRLPAFYTFQTPTAAPDPVDLARERTPVFGSFNNPGKLDDKVLSTWARILTELPRAQLRFGYRRYFDDAALRRRVLDALQGLTHRVAFLAEAADEAAHFARLGDVDVALDTFPFGGATSTFEALWMGVPVVTLEGTRFVGRVGPTLLRGLDLADLVAADVDGYVASATALSNDRTRLVSLRVALRDRLLRSSYMDYPNQARALEGAYRTMWRRWCSQPS